MSAIFRPTAAMATWPSWNFTAIRSPLLRAANRSRRGSSFHQPDQPGLEPVHQCEQLQRETLDDEWRSLHHHRQRLDSDELSGHRTGWRHNLLLCGQRDGFRQRNHQQRASQRGDAVAHLGIIGSSLQLQRDQRQQASPIRWAARFGLGHCPTAARFRAASWRLSSGSQQYASLPAGIVGSLSNITVMAWVNLTSASNWSRIFDFGNDTTTYMFLTPQNGSDYTARFGISTSGFGRRTGHQLSAGRGHRRVASGGRHVEFGHRHSLHGRSGGGNERQHEHQSVEFGRHHEQLPGQIAVRVRPLSLMVRLTSFAFTTSDCLRRRLPRPLRWGQASC